MFHTTSPRTDDAGIENLIQLKGKTAPRVKPEDLEAAIASEWFFTAAEATGMVDGSGPDVRALHLLTFCVLVLKNGFTVTGESACASPENFDAEIGRRIARENAKQKLWPLLGYALKERLAEQPKKQKEYTAADVVKVHTNMDVKTFNYNFHAIMNDGRKFSGVIPEEDIHSVSATTRVILAECNRQASATA